MEEFLIYMEENPELVGSVFREYYDEQANINGEEMFGDERFGGSDNFEEDPLNLYEDFAHVVGHSAHYQGAVGVIRELGIQAGFDVEEDDEELQWEILVILDREI
jgi:hypothetical protein